MFETRCRCAIQNMQLQELSFFWRPDSIIKVKRSSNVQKKKHTCYTTVSFMCGRSKTIMCPGIWLTLLWNYWSDNEDYPPDRFQWFYLLRSQHCLGRNALAIFNLLRFAHCIWLPCLPLPLSELGYARRLCHHWWLGIVATCPVGCHWLSGAERIGHGLTLPCQNDAQGQFFGSGKFWNHGHATLQWYHILDYMTWLMTWWI